MKRFITALLAKITPTDLEAAQSRLLKNTHLFDHLSRKTINAIAKTSELTAYKAGELIIKEGDIGDRLFIIEEGSARVFTSNQRGEEIVIARLEEGTYFGEQAILDSTPALRNASVKAITNLSVLEISHQNILNVLNKNTQLKKQLETLGKKQLIEKIFSQLDLFRSIDRDTLLAFENQILIFSDQDIIFSKGDVADQGYFIISGQVEIKLNETNKVSSLTLGPNHFFGKLTSAQQKRNSTAKAIGDVKVLAIKEGVFKKIYENTPRLRAFLGAMQQAYEIPQRGSVTLYQGSYLDMPTISANFKLNDGREIIASRVMGQHVFTMTTVNVPKNEAAIEKLLIEKVDMVRELHTLDNHIIGVTSYGAWDDLGYVCELILENQPITAMQTENFLQAATISPPALEKKDNETLCYCMKVKRLSIEGAIRAGITNLDAITLNTGAGSICGACRSTILNMLGRYSWLPAYINKITKINTDTRSYQLKCYDEKTRLPTYLPGQHITISAFIDPNWMERTYTLTSISGRSDYYEVIIKREEFGYFSRWLFNQDNSQPLLRLSEPQGNFIFDLATNAPAVFFAEKIGIIPALTFARVLSSYHSRRRLHIDYSVAALNELLFTEEFMGIAEQQPNFSFRTRATDTEGFVSSGEIKRLLQDFLQAEFFICGSKTFTSEIAALLKSLHVPRARIKVEEFIVAGESSVS